MRRSLALFTLAAGGCLAQSAWTPKAPLPRPFVPENAAVAIAGRIYLVTPWNVFAYDPRADRWTDAEARLAPFRHDFETVALDGKLYVIGGCAGGDRHIKSAAVDEYAPSTGAWRARAPMPTARMGLAAAAVDGRIYAIGGVDPLRPVTAVEVYDPATNTWTKKRDWAHANVNALATEVVRGKIHVLLRASSPQGIVNVLEEYDPSTDTFRTLAAPKRPRGCAALTAAAGRLLTLGGHLGDEQALATVEAYDPARDAWTVLADLPEPRSCPAAVELNGRVYVLGGSGPVAWKNPLNSVAVLETAALK